MLTTYFGLIPPSLNATKIHRSGRAHYELNDYM
jgi:hypothetical protein